MSKQTYLNPVLSLLILLACLAAGCAYYDSTRVAPDSSSGKPFLPPTLSPTLRPSAFPVQAGTNQEPGSSGQGLDSQPSSSEAEIGCINNLTYISDLTIPDGTVVIPRSTLDKQWEVENSGTCNWDADYQIRLLSGPELGAQIVQPLIPARSGIQVIIRILFTAPEQAGSYHSAWQAYSPQGEPFGDPFYIDFAVETPPTP